MSNKVKIALPTTPMNIKKVTDVRYRPKGIILEYLTPDDDITVTTFLYDDVIGDYLVEVDREAIKNKNYFVGLVGKANSIAKKRQPIEE